MILQVRGVNAAGKSTAVRQLLREHEGRVVDQITRTNPRTGKTTRTPVWRCSGDLYVIGSYDLDGVSPGGGGDHVSGPSGREEAMHYARRVPHLLWESRWGSTEFPKEPWLSEMKSLGYAWAVINTSADECIRRVYQRRIERNRNVGQPLDERRIRQDHGLLERQCGRVRELGVPVFGLDSGETYTQLHDLLVVRGWGCTCSPVRWQWAA